MKKGYIITYMVLVNFFSFGQVDTTSTGEVVDAEILIEKEKQIRFPITPKLNKRPSTKNTETAPVDWSFKSITPNFSWPSYPKKVNMAGPQEQSFDGGYQSYVKLGYGNYRSPLFAAGTHYRVNPSLLVSGETYYESFGSGPVNGANSSSSTGNAEVSASYILNKLSFTPGISYRSNGFSYYGNTNRMNEGFPSEPVIDASARNLRFDVLAEGEGNNLSYFVQPLVFSTHHLMKDSTDINTEKGFGFLGDLDIRVDSSFQAGLKLEGYQSSYNGSIKYDRSLFKLVPRVSHRLNNLLIEGGFSVASGSISGINKESGFYPFLHLDVDFSDTWKLFGFFDSDIQWSDLDQFLVKNPFLEDSLILLNTRMTSSFGGGIKGVPFDRFSFSADARLENFEDFPFFIPSVRDSARYTLTYDDRTVNRVMVRSQASLALGRSHYITADLKLYSYTTKSEEEPWHLPSYTFQLLTSHKIKQRLLVSTEWIVQGGIKAPVSAPVRTISLKDFIDFNLNTSYQINDRASVFIKVNNVFDNEYEKFVGYPVRGLTFKVGGKYSF